MLVAEAGLAGLGVAAMIVGDTTIAAGAAGALAGIVGGHLNGTVGTGGSNAPPPA